MNQDEIKNAVQLAMTFMGALLLSHGVVTQTEWSGLTGAVLALVGPAWSIFLDHWNKKKVPETAVVVPTSLMPGARQ